MSVDTSIVVCRYQEDLSWLSSLDVPKFIYNKGSDYIDGCIVSENVGREGESFIRYIVDRYEYINERTFFLQGNPFDHCPDVVEKINDQNFFGGLGDILICNGDGSPHHGGLPIDEVCIQLGLPTQSTYSFYVGGQMSVRKQNITNRTLDWWKRCYDVYNSHSESPWVFERLWPIIFQ